MENTTLSMAEAAVDRVWSVQTMRLLIGALLVALPHALAYSTLPTLGLANSLEPADEAPIEPVALSGLAPLALDAGQPEWEDVAFGERPILALAEASPTGAATIIRSTTTTTTSTNTGTTADSDLIDASPLSFGALLHRSARDFLRVSGDSLSISGGGMAGGTAAGPSAASGSGTYSPGTTDAFADQGFINGLVDDGSDQLGFTGTASGGGGGGGGGGGSSSPDNPNLFTQAGGTAPVSTDSGVQGESPLLGDSEPLAPAPVPLPPGLILLASGLLGLWFRGRGRNRGAR